MKIWYRPIVYFDMDEVLADLDGGLFAHSGHHQKEMDRSDFFDMYLPAYTLSGGFESQKVLRNAKKLVDNVLELCHNKEINVAILTSAGKFFDPQSEVVAQKKRWLEKNFPVLANKPFITVSSGADKAMLAHPKAFLIDDHDKNIAKFIAASGHGIVYTPDVVDEVIPKIIHDLMIK